MTDVVYVPQTAVTFYNGAPITVHRGDIWYADHPLVKEQPQLFTSDPNDVAITTPDFRPPSDLPVEQATAAPGEVRARVKRG